MYVRASSTSTVWRTELKSQKSSCSNFSTPGPFKSPLANNKFVPKERKEGRRTRAIAKGSKKLFSKKGKLFLSPFFFIFPRMSQDKIFSPLAPSELKKKKGKKKKFKSTSAFSGLAVVLFQPDWPSRNFRASKFAVGRRFWAAQN